MCASTYLASPALTYMQASLLKKLFTEEPIFGQTNLIFRIPHISFVFFFFCCCFLTSILALASASQLLPSLSFSSEQSDFLSFGPGDLRATFWPLLSLSLTSLPASSALLDGLCLPAHPMPLCLLIFSIHWSILTPVPSALIHS